LKLNIFGKKYRVVKDKTMPDGQVGLCNNEDALILIDAELVDSEYMRIVLHEMIHAIISRVGIDQSEMSHDVEEIICGAVSTSLVENFQLKKI
jgi:hypothetical protein